MDAKTYLKVSIINLAFLVVGILIGVGIVGGLMFLQVVHAQNTKANPTEGVPTSDVPSIKVTRDPNAEYVTPAVGLGGPVVTNTLLANRIACDRLQVGDFDILKIDDAILSLLQRKGFVNESEIRTVIANGKAEHPLRINPTEPTKK